MSDKKKLIRIEPVKGLFDSSPYAPKVSAGITFGFAGPAEQVKDGVRYRDQVSGFFSCREQLCEVPRSFLHSHHCISGFNETRDDLDMDRYRLLIAVRGNSYSNNGTGSIKERIFSGKRILNILEEEAGWMKSVITTVKHTYFKDEANEIFLLTGPKEWMSVPQLVSFSTLIIRLSYKMGAVEVNDIKDVYKVFKEWAATDKNIGNDKGYIAETRKYVSVFLKNINKIFHEGSERYYVQPEAKLGGWSGCGGVSSCFKCSSGNEDLSEKMKEFVFNANK